MIDFESSVFTRYESGQLDEPDSRYLEKYWLNIASLEADWADALDTAFDLTPAGPEVSSGLPAEPRPGGVLFTEEEFADFKRVATGLGAKRFAVIEYMVRSVGGGCLQVHSSGLRTRWTYPGTKW